MFSYDDYHYEEAKGFMKKYVRYVLIMIAVIVFGILYSCERSDSDIDVVEMYEFDKVEGSTTVDLDETTDMTSKNICIHVTGYVVNPGVYELKEGSRVYEAIVLAGGFREEADRDYINQAAVLSDGQRLYVYSKDETSTAVRYTEVSSSQQNDSLVNINTASKERLMTLPGIGESRAESIIAYRQENGGFKTIEDIMRVSGIKDAAFNKIKEYICID